MQRIILLILVCTTYILYSGQIITRGMQYVRNNKDLVALYAAWGTALAGSYYWQEQQRQKELEEIRQKVKKACQEDDPWVKKKRSA